MNVKDKNILFFSPSFFGFDKKIRNRLIELGAKVDLYDDRPSNSFWGKAILRVSNFLMYKNIRDYYNGIACKLKNHAEYDYIFLLNLEAMPVSFLKELRDSNPKAKIVIYMWDSIRRKKHTIDYRPYCDKMFTFDKEDKKMYDSIEFLPLFYLNEYAEIAKNKEYDYDLCFIGSAHTDRYATVNKVLSQISDRQYYVYWYLQSRKLYLYYRLYNTNFRHSRMSDFNYTPLKSEELLEFISKSKIILDIHSPYQSGLTMRTIETLGAGRKLITTNEAIRDYDFYNPQNIMVIDRHNPIVDMDFFEIPYEPLDKEIYYKYSLDGWLERIFENI